MPFCSDRCRQIDLGRWLREVYSVPVERDPDDERAVQRRCDCPLRAMNRTDNRAA